MHTILMQDIHSISQTGEEEEDDSRREEDEEDEEKEKALKELNREEEVQRGIREQQVIQLRGQMEGDFKNFVRHLEKTAVDYELIQVVII